MSEAMLKKYDGNGSGEKPRSASPVETTLFAEEIIERVTQKMGLGEAKKGIGTDFSELVI